MVILNKKNIDNAIIFTVFFFLTLGNAQYFTETGFNKKLLYAGYGFIILKTIYSIRKNGIPNKFGKLLFFGGVVFLFNIGIIEQNNLLLMTKINLIGSMLLLALVAILSDEGLIDKVEQFKFIEYAILVACAIATILALFHGISVTSLAVEGIGESSLGFTGGLQHKNYFGVAILACFISEYIQKRINKWFICLDIVLIVLSNARTAYILLVIFIVLSNIAKLSKIKMNRLQMHLIASISLIFMLILFAMAYRKIAFESQSYQLRYQGLMNYLNMYRNDRSVMLLGNAEMAFRPGHDYTYNIRSVTGWNGTTELSLLSILVKNGVIGLVGYVAIFIYRLIQILNMKFLNIKYYTLAMWTIFIVSAFVETYISNINLVFCPFCYIAIGSLVGIYNKEELKNYD